MGRGRAKAKQTKVARELKYYTPDTNLDALQRELHGAPPATARTSGEAASDDEDDERRVRPLGRRLAGLTAQPLPAQLSGCSPQRQRAHRQAPLRRRRPSLPATAQRPTRRRPA